MGGRSRDVYHLHGSLRCALLTMANVPRPATYSCLVGFVPVFPDAYIDD